MNYAGADFKITLKDIRDWLLLLDGKSHLGTLARLEMERLNQATQSGNDEQVEQIVQTIIKDSQVCRHDCEIAEIYFDCAATLFAVGQRSKKPGCLHQAAEYLKTAMEKYTGSCPQRALLGWARGYILWSIPEYHDQARVAWGACIEEIRFFMKYPISTEVCLGKRNFQEQFREWIRKMESDLRFVVMHTMVQQPSPKPKTAPRPTTKPASKTRRYPIYDGIQAGKFMPVGYETIPNSSLEIEIGKEIDQALIDGIPYRVISLRPGQRLSLQEAAEYGGLRVHGDSMNRANIEDGDYVIIRLQPNADDHEIVVAQIYDTEAQATLKRYLVQGRSVILRPESDNPEHTEHVFFEPGEEFSIIGIVLAVLKK